MIILCDRARKNQPYTAMLNYRSSREYKRNGAADTDAHGGGGRKRVNAPYVKLHLMPNQTGDRAIQVDVCELTYKK